MSKMKSTKNMKIKDRLIGEGYPPLAIAEIGINHDGSLAKAKQMVDAAQKAGCQCVKFQCHVLEDEMIPEAANVIPGNAAESIWDIMEKAHLSEAEDITLKEYVESKDMIYLSTPFSRAAADRLEKMGVDAYKIGSGECNNYPLVEHVARFGKPVILSTGMNDISSVQKSVAILRQYQIPYALLHCTSIYPTPYDKVRLGALDHLKRHFPDALLGLSDHALENYCCFAAVALGACILEKHFTCDKNWPGPDNAISIDPAQLQQLIEGSAAIFQALGGAKNILPEEQPTIDFAYACVVTIKDIDKGEPFTKDNIWVKRPGTGQIKAEEYPKLLGKTAACHLKKDAQLKREDII